MRIVALRDVREFVDALDMPVRADVEGLMDLLKEYGHKLPMPYAKPIGKGLWELRRTGRPQIRILYGFCGGDIVLVLSLQKQRSALRPKEIATARERLRAYCAT
ncbi:MAG: type II toxin-antitoxin system RelE/ParE family toxin [Minisyncoccia bacterium]